MRYRRAQAADWPRIEALLRDAALPVEDAAQHLQHFTVGIDEKGIVAVGGFELDGAVALLRSFVVAEAVRRHGHGAELLRHILRAARQSGVDTVYLLTQTAEPFFARHGFTPVARNDAPPAIRRTREFTGLCPASARLMTLSLSHLNPCLAMVDASIRAASTSDAAAICAIYNHYVTATAITFEEEAVADAEMAQRIADVGAARLPWLVAEVDGRVVGYAYATKWRVRPAYRHSVESTVYVDKDHGGRGIGRALYGALLDALRERGLHLVIGGIAQPNAASVGLHETLGFRKVAHFSEVGLKFGRWIDVGYWELKLAR